MNNLVDSSGWLEYFADGPNADEFSVPLQDPERLIVPTVIIYEVFKVVLRERGEDEVLQVIALMRQGKVVDLTFDIAVQAARVSHEYKIPMADSVILATARLWNATIWTQDEDFKGIENVRFFPKR